nr:hypothetical protein [Tanacetum cinerariifolium]
MATAIDQQVALDEALVPKTKRLRNGRSNFRLPSDIQSKESTLQVVYDEFWATAIVHHHSIRFKINNKKHITNLETFRDMLHVCPRVPGQSFDELPFEAEILEFLRSLGHSDEIRHLTDVNVNKLFQPWRSFGEVINNCLTGKSFGFDSFRLSQAQLLDDNIFSTIKVVSRHQDTQQYGVILPIELTNEDIRNTTAYKEYYAYATGVAALKPKASARKKRGYSDTSLTPPIATSTPITTAAPVLRLSAAAKDERTGSRPGVSDVPSDDLKEELSWNTSDDEDVDAQDEGDKNDESDDGSDDGNDDDNDETVK